MSGETGVETAVHGAIQAVREFNSRVILVGDEEVISHTMLRFAENSDNVEIVASDEVIDMHESPANRQLVGWQPLTNLPIGRARRHEGAV